MSFHKLSNEFCYARETNSFALNTRDNSESRGDVSIAGP